MNNFIEINELGKGKFGTVKAMLDPKSGEKFAIKCIRIDPGNPDDRNTITSTREIEALKTIKHDNVVEFVDSWIEDDSSAQKKSKILCIRMELCGSIDLYDWLDQINQRKYSDVLEWFQQVLNAMNYVHSNGWFHRDIKPANILLSERGILKLADFGLATKIKKEADGRRTPEVGTVPFMAPELKTSKYNAKCDFFSLGGVLVHLMSLESSEKVNLALKKNKFPSSLETEHPKSVLSLIVQLRDENHKKRPSAEELQKELNILKKETDYIYPSPTTKKVNFKKKKK